MDQARLAVVREWIQTDFRRYMNKDIDVKHLALLKVGRDHGDPPNEILRYFVASVVFDAAGMPPPDHTN